MHVAFGRVRRSLAQLRTGFSLMRNGYSESEMVLHLTANTLLLQKFLEKFIDRTYANLACSAIFWYI